MNHLGRVASPILQLDKKNFKLLLQYMEGLKGNQRSRVVEEARQKLEQYEQQEEEVGERVLKYQYKRAVEVLRVLA